MAEPTTTLSAFSSPGAGATPWARALDELTRAELFWLSTVRPEGRPHTTPLLATWHDDALYVTTGDQERKAYNLRANPHCVATTGTNRLDGLDVVVEGTAAEVSDPAERDAVAGAFERKYGPHLGPDGTWTGMGEAIRTGGVLLFRIEPTVAFGFGKGEFYSQTRYAFG